MARIEPRKRPHYPPAERLAILSLKAARGWSTAQTARAFELQPQTIASWLKEVRENGQGRLLSIPEPVNRFPDFVRAAVRRLKTLCPLLGRVKIAQILARAGLHLSASSVRRMIREKPVKPPPLQRTPAPSQTVTEATDQAAEKRLTADYPDHVNHVDLTVVPTAMGLWTSWLPLSLPQVWPFCWWLLVMQDHFSRRIQGCSFFRKQPTSLQVRTVLGRWFAAVVPNYLICDRGGQFDCGPFRAWCRRRGIKPRYGAVGRHGSIALIERLIRTIKDEWTRRIVVPLRRSALTRSMAEYATWHNEHRPHQSLRGKTPNEIYFGRPAANERPRIEPRARWPLDSPCAAPQAPVEGFQKPGQRFTLWIRHRQGRLPIVRLTRAA
jgi:transposase InsO family protein